MPWKVRRRRRLSLSRHTSGEELQVLPGKCSRKKRAVRRSSFAMAETGPEGAPRHKVRQKTLADSSATQMDGFASHCGEHRRVRPKSHRMLRGRVRRDFWRRTPRSKYGPGRDRTGGLHNANVALSQLSYGPTKL